MLCAKVSILLLYKRLFNPDKMTRWAIYASLALVIAHNLGIMFATIFDCPPSREAMDFRSRGAKCISFNQPKGVPKMRKIAIIGGALNVFTDVIILILPVPVVWKLQLPRRQRVAVLGIFATGVL